MKNLKLPFLIGVCFIFLLSCNNGNEPKSGNDTILNYTDFGEFVKEGSITPISVTVYVGRNSREVCISEKRDSLELVMKDYFYYRHHDENPSGVKYESPTSYKTSLTVYNLKPATTYYYFVTEDGYNPGDPRKIGPIHSFKTEDLNLYVDIGGSIVWCGVNYLENRDEFHFTQFLSNSLFEYNELPNPAYETIQGNWRYPTKLELQELSETSTVTMVDFNKDFVRLTSAKGINLYIPFTYQKWGDGWTDGYQKLMLIPADDKNSGLYIRTPKLRLSNKIYENDFGDFIKCGDELKEFKLKIADSENNECKRFFHWSYTHVSSDGSKQEKSGDARRGVRFVREK